MLIEFGVANFRSFHKIQTLSMVASALTQHRDTHTFEARLPGFERFLRSSAIYGANAAGKTNLLLAIKFMQDVVLTSASQGYAYAPFKLCTEALGKPSEFQITFAHNNTLYEYGFSLTESRITSEWLTEYVTRKGRRLFQRQYDEKKKSYEWDFSSHLRGQKTLWSSSTRPNALFLSTAVQLNNTQLKPVFEWFQKRLVIIAGPTSLNASLTLRLIERDGGIESVLPFLHEADFHIAGVEVKREPLPQNAAFVSGDHFIEKAPGENVPHIVTVSFLHRTTDSNETVAMPISDESSGTQAFFQTAGAYLNVLQNGEVLLVDEIDRSLHPLLTRFLINKFNSHSNEKNAQIIFSTHNVSLMDKDLFRRDQIWFVEKRDDAASWLYPLTDFHPREDEALARGYLRGRYGALPIVDQS